MSSLIKNIFLLVGVLVTCALGYYLYTQQTESIAHSSNKAVSEDVAAQSAEFLRSLNELQAIQLDNSIFSDPRFSSLVNFSYPVEPVPVGKSNPFEVN